MLAACVSACSSPAANRTATQLSPSPLATAAAAYVPAPASAPATLAREGESHVASAAADVPKPAPAPSGPEIYSVRTTPAVVHGGDSVVWDVRTTPDVVKVVARTSLYALALNRVAPGHFVLSFAIPNGVPAFFHGNYNLDVAADTEAGDTAHRHVSLSFQ
jgi:hypothetical protein